MKNQKYRRYSVIVPNEDAYLTRSRISELLNTESEYPATVESPEYFTQEEDD